MECGQLHDNVDKILECSSLKWSSDDDADHKLAGKSCFSEEDSLRAGKCFPIELFCPIKGTAHAMRENLYGQAFSDAVSCPFKRFYINII